MSWYVGKSLEKLLGEINASAPNRSKISDGSIGDASHSASESDHNPCDCHSAVCARDFTHDPAQGFDSYAFAEWLRNRCQSGAETRVKYIISNGRIASVTYGFKWQTYTGSNKHDHHVHISVDHPQSLFDSTASWGWGISDDGGDDWLAEPKDVWGVEWGNSGKSAMTFIDTLDELASQKTWSMKPWSSTDPPSAGVALQRMYGMCQDIQKRLTEIEKKLG